MSHDELFDAAVDVLVDIIHETMELQENVAVIQEIVPRLTALGPNLADPATLEDEDKVRGYCRVFVEAGEWYEPLIVQHPASFLPLVELIKQCAAYQELEVVGITLNFWYRLAKGILKVGPSPALEPLIRVFADLVGIVIGHLHYPDEASQLSGEDRDTFRDFRYKIGDTLKDCCEVLGSGPCLQQAYDIISRAVAAGDAVKWQDVEAPLFSMRSMGSKIDVRDNDLVPRIMEMLPKLPPHPRIRYAAILVIGRYTHWTQQHPEHIQFQLPYVSAGFDESDPEVLAAASQTMKYLCKDCAEHLVPFLPQLHTFIQSVSAKLNGEDLLDLSAAIAHILQAMPPADVAQALSTFVMPNIELVHGIATQEQPASKDQLRKAADALERVDVYLAIIGPLPEGQGGLPASCAATCEQVWAVLDALIARYGSVASIANRTCIAIRRGLVFFGDLAFAVAPAVLERLATAFELAPASDYLWITGKLVQQFAARGDAAFSAAVKGAFERESSRLFDLLQSTPPAQVPDSASLFLSPRPPRRRRLTDLRPPPSSLPRSLPPSSSPPILTSLLIDQSSTTTCTSSKRSPTRCPTTSSSRPPSLRPSSRPSRPSPSPRSESSSMPSTRCAPSSGTTPCTTRRTSTSRPPSTPPSPRTPPRSAPSSRATRPSSCSSSSTSSSAAARTSRTTSSPSCASCRSSSRPSSPRRSRAPSSAFRSERRAQKRSRSSSSGSRRASLSLSVARRPLLPRSGR